MKKTFIPFNLDGKKLACSVNGLNRQILRKRHGQTRENTSVKISKSWPESTPKLIISKNLKFSTIKHAEGKHCIIYL